MASGDTTRGAFPATFEVASAQCPITTESPSAASTTAAAVGAAGVESTEGGGAATGGAFVPRVASTPTTPRRTTAPARIAAVRRDRARAGDVAAGAPRLDCGAAAPGAVVLLGVAGVLA